MQSINLTWMLDPRVLVGACWSMALISVGAILVIVRGRIRVLEYTVHHDRVAVAANDLAFGEIRVTYAGNPIAHLWLSRISLKNDTGKDFEKLEVRVYTGDETKLLGERTEITGSTFQLGYTDEYLEKIKLEQDVQPTDEQLWAYNHRRDYLLPVLNRGDTATWQMLTTINLPEPGKQLPQPNVWLDIQRSGVRVRYKRIGPEIHGVPLRRALLIGLGMTGIVYTISVLFFLDPWAAAIPSTVCALFAQSVGAYVYKAIRLVMPVIVH